MSGVLSVAGLSLVVGVLVQIVKQWTVDGRLLNVIALALALLIAEIGTAITSGLTGQKAFEAFLLAVAATGSTTWIAESISNLRGLAGDGPRSDDNRLAQAVTTVLTDETGKALVTEVLKKDGALPA